MRDFTIAKWGDNSVAAKVAQRLITLNMEEDEYGLDDDGIFGAKTYNAAVRFQKRPGRTPPLRADGVVGPKTFAALGLRPVVEHPVQLRAQRQPASCWAAAAAMMLGGREPGHGPAQPDRNGRLVSTDHNVQLFAKGLGWDYLPGRAQDTTLAAKLQRAPIWMGGDSINARSTMDAIHAVVLGGMYTYTWAGSDMCLLKIYDPWPIGVGRIYFMEFDKPRLPGKNTFSVRWFLSPMMWSP